MARAGERVIGILESSDAAALSAPDALAVRDETTSLTRSELNLRSHALAGELSARGVRPGDRVGVCVERSAALIVAVLGVVRAGAAYVAIDPAYPAERIGWMLEDSGASAVVVSAGGRPSGGPENLARVVLGSDGAVRDAVRDGVADARDTAEPAPADDAPAYIVYTSGSSGRPKGVVIGHAALANLVDWHCGAFGLTGADMCTQIASPGFDAAVWEIWPALAAGAGLHIVPDTLRTDPLGLRDWIVEREITVGFVPTAVAEGLIALDWPRDVALRTMLAGGDALTRRPRADLPFALVNNYGVSEATVVATSGAVAASGDGPPSIGRLIHGVLGEIVDASDRPLPDGEAGELVLGGVAVGQGYINLAELTAERFYEDARGRWYRTGDRMRFTETGELEFLGRLDDQLSIRGFRVEPGEVAHALNAHPAITASAAVGRGDSSAERRLVAYVVSSAEIRPSDHELADFLAPRLPEHMAPSAYVWLSALPLTAHGKVDYAALGDGVPETAPVLTPVSPEDVMEQIDPNAMVEAQIAAIIADLLGVPTVGPNKNFFLLGGHSLLAAQLIIRLSEMYDIEMPLRYLFDHPTAAELAVEVGRLTREDADLPEVTR